MALLAAATRPATTHADGLAVRALEAGSWSAAVAALQTDTGSDGRVLHVYVEDQPGHRLQCNEYDLALDPVGASAFRIGDCDPASGATALTLTSRAALFALGDVVPRPLPVAIRATVRLDTTTWSAPPRVSGGSEVRCSVAVRPYLTDLLHGTTVFLDPRDYTLQLTNARIHAEAQNPGWTLTTTSSNSQTASVTVEYDIVGNADHRVVLHDRASLTCTSGTATPRESIATNQPTPPDSEHPHAEERLRACLSAPMLSNGAVVSGDVLAHATLQPDGDAGPGDVFRIHVETESIVTVRLVPRFVAAIALFGGCGPGTARIGEDGPTGFVQATVPRSIAARLPAGDYALDLVSGIHSRHSDDHGGYTLSVSVLPILDADRAVLPARVRAETAACTRAPVLTPGNPVRGTLVAGRSQFTPNTCGGGLGAEAVYAIHLPQPRHVEITLQADFPATIYIRAACSDQANDLACRTSAAGLHAGATNLETDLPAGDYEVLVDADVEQAGGSFFLAAIASGDQRM